MLQSHSQQTNTISRFFKDSFYLLKFLLANLSLEIFLICIVTTLFVLIKDLVV